MKSILYHVYSVGNTFLLVIQLIFQDNKIFPGKMSDDAVVKCLRHF